MMRTLLSLLLLSHLALCGCNLPSAETAQAGDDSYLVEEDPLPESLPEPLDSEHSLQSSSPESGGFLESDGPDPLADEPDEPQGLKSSSSGKHSGVWVNFYYFPKHSLNESELARLKGWANQRGLTVASAGDANFRFAKVRLINISDPNIKITRNLVYDGNDKPLFPTLVLTDEAGCDLCHNIGYINLAHLSEDYDKFSRVRSRSRGMMALPPEEKVEVKYEPGASFHMECSGGACRMVRH